MANPSTNMPSSTRLNFHMSFMPSSPSCPVGASLRGRLLGLDLVGRLLGLVFLRIEDSIPCRITRGIRHHGAAERRIAQPARKTPLENGAIAAGKPRLRLAETDLVIDDERRRRLEPARKLMELVDEMAR